MNRHGTDTVSLGFGLVFLTVLAGWLLTRVAEVDLPPVGWLIAGVFVLLGVLGIVVTLRTTGRTTTG
jgi:hypothetical protein